MFNKSFTAAALATYASA